MIVQSIILLNTDLFILKTLPLDRQIGLLRQSFSLIEATFKTIQTTLGTINVLTILLCLSLYDVQIYRHSLSIAGN